MSSATIASLLFANQKIILYLGIPILIFGLIGNILNSIVFLSLKTFRQSSCAFYLTIFSMINIGQLLAGLLTRIMITGFNIDWTQISLVFCKFRTFAYQTTSMISFACISLATIDQYLATSSHQRWQRMNHIKFASRIVLITILICVFIQTPCLIFYNFVYSSINNSSSCQITSQDFIQFNIYFNYLLIGNTLPYVITFSFALMAYYNTRTIAYRTIPLIRRELDKQLTNMVLIHIFYMCFSLVPNTTLYFILSFGNIENLTIRAQLQCTYTVTLCLYYTYFGSAFYIYVCVSERFRRQFAYVFFQRRRIHVFPIGLL